MAQPTKEAKRQQDSIGAEGKALTEQELRAKTLNALTVSGGLISTERDDMGNILLHEDPNNLGSNKQLVNQYMSVMVERRDYNDGEIQKVFDTEINELFKSPKTKTADELREEIERMRRLLAEAEADIIVQEVVSDGDGTGDGDGDGTSPTGTEVLLSGDRLAPYTLEVEGFTINVQTAIWNTDTQRIEPNQLNVPSQRINYEISRNNETGQITARFTSGIANPEYFQGWYFDSENLGNTQDYIAYGGQKNIISMNLTDEREANQGDENKFTFAVAYKDEAPPVVTTDRLTFQMIELISGQLVGARDDVEGRFTWRLSDSEGNVVDQSGAPVNNPFDINVIPGQTLRVSMIDVEGTDGVISLGHWYTVTDNNTWKKQDNVSGRSGNVVTFTIPDDIKQLILSYNGYSEQSEGDGNRNRL